MSSAEHTTSADTKQRIELPPSLMACITALAGDSTLTAGERLTGVLMMIYGRAWYEQQDAIDPTGLRCRPRNGRGCALTSPTAFRTTPSPA